MNTSTSTFADGRMKHSDSSSLTAHSSHTSYASASTSADTGSHLPSSCTRLVRPGIAPLVPTTEQQWQLHLAKRGYLAVDASRMLGAGVALAENGHEDSSIALGIAGSRSCTSTSVSTAATSSSSYTTTTRSSSTSSSVSMHHPSLSRTSSCSSRTSSSSSIVRAIDFAYCLPSPDLFDGVAVGDPRRGKSSPIMSRNTLGGAAVKLGSRRLSSSGVLLSRTSSSASAASSSCTGSRSSLSSRRSSVYASSPSSSLASQFRDWAFAEGPLRGDDNNSKLPRIVPQSRTMSFHPITTDSTHHHQQQSHTLSSSPASSSDIFSPMTDVPPLPPSVYPSGMDQEEEFGGSAIIDDVEGLICFQPGCETVINPNTYYCDEHDDPFGDDA